VSRRLYDTGYVERGPRGWRPVMVEAKPEWGETGDWVVYTGEGGWQFQREEFERLTGAKPGDRFVVMELKVRRDYTDYQLHTTGSRWFNTCMFKKEEK
jgi:hypothetical protein